MDQGTQPPGLPVTASTALPPSSSPLDNLPSEQWLKEVATLPVGKQVDAVRRRLHQLNPGFHGNVTSTVADGMVAGLDFYNDKVVDLSPLALRGLKVLKCLSSGPAPGELSDLSPLVGLPLVTLGFGNSQVADLSPLKGMPLTELNCALSKVSDLSPIKSLRLKKLICFRATKLSDLSPLQGMPLETLNIVETKVSDLTPLKECKNLQALKLNGCRVTPAGVAELQKALPNCNIEWDGAKETKTPAPVPASYAVSSVSPSSPPAAGTLDSLPFDQWMKAVAALPVGKQVDAVAKKLQQLNPGFDGDITSDVTGGVVTGLTFNTGHVIDIPPVRTLTGLAELHCGGVQGGKAAKLSDLSPLAGMKLTRLTCGNSEVSDLAPLRGLPLEQLGIAFTRSPTSHPCQECPLKRLNISNLKTGPVKINLSPLQGMPLEYLDTLGFTKLSGLSPLKDCKNLQTLKLSGGNVTAADVAAVRKALPKCKIELDGTAKP